MRLTTLLRRLLGVTQMYVKQVEMAADCPLVVSVAAFAVRDVRAAGAAV